MAKSLNSRIRTLVRRWRWWLASAGILFSAYAAAGFLLVPQLAKEAIQSYGEKTLKRHVAIDGLAFNPFSLAAEIRGFSLSEADGAPIAAFDRLRIDFQLSSIFNAAWTFKEISLDNPSLNILVSANGALNLAALVPPADESKRGAEPAAIPALRIAAFSIRGGSVKLEDRSRGRRLPPRLRRLRFC